MSADELADTEKAAAGIARQVLNPAPGRTLIRFVVE